MAAFLNQLSNMIPNATVLAAFATVVEIALRLIPSQKPLSIAYAVEDTIAAVAQLLGKVGDALNHVIPQRVTPPSA